MSGETDLQTLLKSISPALIDGDFVFLTFPGAGYGEHSELQPIASFSEAEGLTLVVPKALADKRALAYDSIYNGITLGVHSSLEAVGLTAAFAKALAESEISANVIAGYYHDHIFVQQADSQRAMTVLGTLSGN